jgi:hypothetical protein
MFNESDKEPCNMTSELDTDDVSSDLSGQFLRQADFEDGRGKVFTIARVEKTRFEAKNGRPEEKKWVLTFDDDRSLSLNRTNLALLAKYFGKHSSKWVGQTIAVYRDESVSFGGRLVGGLRVRRASPHDLAPDDEIGF